MSDFLRFCIWGDFMSVTETVLKYTTVCENTENKISVIVVCGGNSRRMGGIDKMFAEVKGLPVCVRSIMKFQNLPEIDNIVVVTKNENILKMQQMCDKFNLFKVTDIVEGGNCRQHSVLNGFNRLCDETSIVLIHDGARPFTDAKCIKRVIDGVKQHSAVTCAVKVKDTVKEIDSENTVISTPDRSKLVAVQTPQGFEYNLYKSAVEGNISRLEDFTDDCSIVEASGYAVYTVDGDYKNIKITTEEDLKIAEVFAED